MPAHFFSMFSPPRNDAAARASRDRIDEDIRFAAKVVRRAPSLPLPPFPLYPSARALTTPAQITNVCIALNELPYIRYYLPAHHPPLGALAPHATTRAAPPPPDTARRWRTDLARGADARAYEAADSDFLPRVLAFAVQAALDEHKRANPDFPVRPPPRPLRSRVCVCATRLISRACAETGARARARDADRDGPLDGRHGAARARVHVPGDGERPPPHRGRREVHVRAARAAHPVLANDDTAARRYKFQSSLGAFEDKTATLSDADTVWADVRHMHMREAIDKLMADFNRFMADNAGFKGCVLARSLACE